MTLLNPGPHRPLPRGTGTLATVWFIAGLGMLFFATMAGYIIVRLARAQVPDETIPAAYQWLTVPLGAMRSAFPWGLWVSTLVVIAASVTIQLAVHAATRERQSPLRLWTRVTLVLGLLFCAIQAPCMWKLLNNHFNQLESFNPAVPGKVNQLYGLIFVLILLHALHVIGGLIHLIYVDYLAHAGRIDHEHYGPLKHAAMYWHFLDVVWILMFAILFAAG